MIHIRKITFTLLNSVTLIIKNHFGWLVILPRLYKCPDGLYWWHMSLDSDMRHQPCQWLCNVPTFIDQQSENLFTNL